jgi:hypothetical protein
MARTRRDATPKVLDERQLWRSPSMFALMHAYGSIEAARRAWRDVSNRPWITPEIEQRAICALHGGDLFTCGDDPVMAAQRAAFAETWRQLGEPDEVPELVACKCGRTRRPWQSTCRECS